jgi:glycosyltransferase involved in cell wall biosynthesis
MSISENALGKLSKDGPNSNNGTKGQMVPRYIDFEGSVSGLDLLGDLGNMPNDRDLPLVSIIVPSYNQARFLEETILSVVSQCYSSIELIVIDGGSKDGSVEIIRKYEDQITYWESEPDDGQSHAINKGYVMSKGEIVNWLCSDDVLMPGAISAVVEALLQNPKAAGVFSDAISTDEESQVIGRFVAKKGSDSDLIRFWTKCWDIPQPTLYLRRSVIMEVGLYLDEKWNHAMDYDFWCRSLVGKSLILIERPIATYRRHKSAKTTGSDRWIDEKLAISRGYWGERWKLRYLMLSMQSALALRKRSADKFWKQACTARAEGYRVQAATKLFLCLFRDPVRLIQRHWLAFSLSLLPGYSRYRVLYPHKPSK